MNEPPYMLGRLALRHRLIGESTLTECLSIQEERARIGHTIRLGELFIQRGLLSMPAVRKLLAYQQQLRLKSAKTEPSTTRAASGATSTRGRVLTRNDRIGDFIIDGSLGKGAMGDVYRARRISDDRVVALKVLNSKAADEQDLIKRFKREAQFMLALNHPHIVNAYDVGVSGGYHYLSMEYVPGENLLDRISRQRRIEPVEALRMMKQIAEALQYGGERGLVHRDLKPENILIRPDGVCKLTDLGLAIIANREDLRLTMKGMAIGTPLYMSPEQAKGERDVDTRSDVYSLGCTFYHAICGDPPFTGKRLVDVMQQHVRATPPRPSQRAPGLPAGVEAILLRCLEKERDKRFQTCGQLVRAIDRVLESPRAAPQTNHQHRDAPVPPARKRALVQAPPVPTVEPAAREDPAESRMLLVLMILFAIVALLLVAVAGLGVLIAFNGRP